MDRCSTSLPFVRRPWEAYGGRACTIGAEPADVWFRSGIRRPGALYNDEVPGGAAFVAAHASGEVTDLHGAQCDYVAGFAAGCWRRMGRAAQGACPWQKRRPQRSTSSTLALSGARSGSCSRWGPHHDTYRGYVMCAELVQQGVSPVCAPYRLGCCTRVEQLTLVGMFYLSPASAAHNATLDCSPGGSLPC